MHSFQLAYSLISTLCLVVIALRLTKGIPQVDFMKSGDELVGLRGMGLNNLVAAGAGYGAHTQRIAGSMPSGSTGPQENWSKSEFASNPEPVPMFVRHSVFNMYPKVDEKVVSNKYAALLSQGTKVLPRN
jgi:hypothetical protein